MSVLVLVNLAVLAISLESDLGRRKVTWFRVLRPAVAAAVVVPFFFGGLSLSGNGLLLEIGGVLAGVLLGCATMCFLRFEYDETAARVYTRAGWAYVAAWVGLTAVKMSVSYGASELWPRQTGMWLVHNGITPDAFKSALIFLNVAMVLARVAVIGVRGARTRTRVAV